MTEAVRQLTVLGGCGAFPEPGRACSGFLVEWDGFTLVLDLGYATLPRLLAHCPDVGKLDAVVVTHEHPDHCIDLHGLFRIRHYGGTAGRLPLYCPPGVVDRLAHLEPDVALTDVFHVHGLPDTYDLGPFRLSAVALPHFVPDAGVRLVADGTVIAYTGDTGPSPHLAALGRDADLFVVEATDRPGETARSERNLLTAAEAGAAAARAGAHRLLLTHFWPGTDRSASVAAAARSFGGPIVVADEETVVHFDR